MHRTATFQSVLLAILALLFAWLPAQAQAEGYWRFKGYDLSPKQAQFDETARGTPAGRVWEARVSGAFQAEYAGKGTIDLFFKYDDVDRHVYTTTVTYSFGAQQDMSVLVPGQKVEMEAAASVESSDSIASGGGSVWVNNGDNIIYFETHPREQKSAQGSFTVPGGGANDTLRVSATGGLYGAGGAIHATITVFYDWVEGPVPPKPADQGTASSAEPAGNTADTAPPDQGERVPGGDILGPAIEVNEIQGWSGVWTRRPGTDIFDASWTNADGRTASDVIRIVSVSGHSVVLVRESNGGTYRGRVSPDGHSIEGTASWYPEGATWSGNIAGGDGQPTPPDGGIVVVPGDSSGEDAGTGSHWDTTTPPSSGPALFIDNWNTAACQMTDRAVLDVQQQVHLDRFDLWMKWPAGRSRMRYSVQLDGRDIGGGTLRRGDCDPYQTDWCVGTDRPDADLTPGQYEITADEPALCQNAGSQHSGFVRAWGH